MSKQSLSEMITEYTARHGNVFDCNDAEVEVTRWADEAAALEVDNKYLQAKLESRERECSHVRDLEARVAQCDRAMRLYGLVMQCARISGHPQQGFALGLLQDSESAAAEGGSDE